MNSKQKKKGVSVEFGKEQGDFINDLFMDNCCLMLTKMRKPSIIVAIIETHRKGGQEVALDFWRKVRDGDSLDYSDPRLKLRDYLANLRAGRRDLRNICIKAWNLYRQKKTIEGNLFCNQSEGLLFPL